ncbi:hypothetical protein Golomagni_02736 [Golovinomyces magnicellulatus]|nr:hypothetical protein Golomagni_02736 [Golovinomyces magnicellulatus]
MPETVYISAGSIPLADKSRKGIGALSYKSGARDAIAIHCNEFGLDDSSIQAISILYSIKRNLSVNNITIMSKHQQCVRLINQELELRAGAMNAEILKQCIETARSTRKGARERGINMEIKLPTTNAERVTGFPNANTVKNLALMKNRGVNINSFFSARTQRLFTEFSISVYRLDLTNSTSTELLPRQVRSEIPNLNPTFLAIESAENRKLPLIDVSSSSDHSNNVANTNLAVTEQDRHMVFATCTKCESIVAITCALSHKFAQHVVTSTMTSTFVFTTCRSCIESMVNSKSSDFIFNTIVPDVEAVFKYMIISVNHIIGSTVHRSIEKYRGTDCAISSSNGCVNFIRSLCDSECVMQQMYMDKETQILKSQPYISMGFM